MLIGAQAAVVQVVSGYREVVFKVDRAAITVDLSGYNDQAASTSRAKTVKQQTSQKESAQVVDAHRFLKPLYRYTAFLSYFR